MHHRRRRDLEEGYSDEWESLDGPRTDLCLRHARHLIAHAGAMLVGDRYGPLGRNDLGRGSVYQHLKSEQ